MSTTILATWERPGKVAMEAAWQAHARGESLISALEQGLAAAEEDPSLIAIGLGSVPNSDGELELDASIMDGRDLSAGAVCSVRGILPVISLARRVMDKTRHIMLSGEQARRFAIEQGFKPRNLMTAESIRRYEEWLEQPEREKDYVHAAGDKPSDTVTVLGLEEGPHVVAASSTSGLSFKRPGRVGDSPIIGAGIYADDETGAAGATGNGEELWKACASFRTVDAMSRGLNAQEACDETIRAMLRRQPASTDMPCVVFAISINGDYGAATTTGEFPLWVCEEGVFTMKRFRPVEI